MRDFASIVSKAVLLAAGATLLFVSLQSVPIVEAVLSPDLAIRLRSLFGPEPVNRLPVTVLAIDDPTFFAWGQRLGAPRKELFDVVDGARQRRARSILVDVDITAARAPDELDVVLTRLRAYASRTEAPPLLLARGLWREPASNNLPTRVSVRAYGGLAEEMGRLVSKIDSLVEAATNLIWVSVLHEAADDGVIRHASSFEFQCDPDRGFFTPVMVAAALDSGSASLSDLKRAARGLADERCGALARRRGEDAPVLKPLIARARSNSPVRIAFGFNGRDWTKRDVVREDGKPPVEAFVMRSALPFARSAATDPDDGDSCGPSDRAAPTRTRLSCDGVRDRLVLVGETHRDAGDVHATPLGSMSGVHILANGMMNALRLNEDVATEALRSRVATGITIVLISVIWLLPRRTLIFVSCLIAFVLLSGWMGLDAAFTYEAAANAIFLYSAFKLTDVVLDGLGQLRRRASPVLTRHRILPPSLVVAAGLSAATGSTDAARAQDALPVASVVRITAWSGGPGEAVVRHVDGSTQRLLSGDYVFPGDHVSVPGHDATVVIERRSGILELCRHGSPPASCSARFLDDQDSLARAVEFWRGLRTLVSYYDPGRTDPGQVRTLGTRDGGNLEAPLSRGQEQRLKAGSSPVWIAWAGGMPPFGVRAEQDGRTWGATTTHAREASFAAPALGPGELRISITDANGRSLQIQCRVLDAFPEPPSFADAATGPTFDRFYQAAWLSRQQGGALRLEAARRLAALAPELPAARSLLLAIAAGERLK